jgi:hypothetical protein|tara:strand:- start:106 stop:693 length:588 start_codon:yes stop_codon:yes gene_type:complete
MKKILAVLILIFTLPTPSQADDKYYIDINFCFTDKTIEIFDPDPVSFSQKKIKKNSWMYPILPDSQCMRNKNFKRYKGTEGYQKYIKWYRSNIVDNKPKLAVQLKRYIVFEKTKCRYPYFSVYPCIEIFFDEKGSYVVNPSKKFKVMYEIKPNVSLDNVDEISLDKLLKAAQDLREEKITREEFYKIKDKVFDAL